MSLIFIRTASAFSLVLRYQFIPEKQNPLFTFPKKSNVETKHPCYEVLALLKPAVGRINGNICFRHLPSFELGKLGKRRFLRNI